MRVPVLLEESTKTGSAVPAPVCQASTLGVLVVCGKKRKKGGKGKGKKSNE